MEAVVEEVEVEVEVAGAAAAITLVHRLGSPI